ncbi:MAG: ATP-binding protein [Actinomycetota bacterium]
MPPSGFPVRVLGAIEVGYSNAKSQTPLSPAKQRLLAALVVARDRGVPWHGGREGDAGGDEESLRAAFRMSVSRLRSHLPPGSIEDIGDGTVRLLLDVADVDTWMLLHLASTDTPLDQVSAKQLLHLLQPVEPFMGVQLDARYESDVRAIYDARNALMIRVANERPDLLRGDFVSFLRGHLLEDPFNERLLATLVMAEAHGGDRRRALRTLRKAIDDFAEVGLEVSAEVAKLEDDLLDPEAQTRFESYVPEMRPPVPQALLDMRTRAHVGHRGELQRLVDLAKKGTGQAVVRGTSGVGKSRLLAELAFRAAEVGIPAIFLRPGPQGSDSTYDPLLTALPGFRAAALPILTQPPSGGTSSLLLATAIDCLAERAGDGTLILIADDAHLLDSGTARLLAQLPSTDVAERIVLVVAATDQPDQDPDTSPTSILADSVMALRIDLGPVTETDLRDMVRQQWPDTLEPLVWNLARQLYDMSSGRAGVASILLASFTEPDVIPDLSNLRGVRPIMQVVQALPGDVARLGAAAAVLGQDFDLRALRAVTGLSTEEIRPPLDDLLRRQLLRETKGLRYEVAHALVTKALLDAADPGQVGEWNELAARHYADNVHSFAIHAFAAGDRFPRQEVLSALEASAQRHLDVGSYWEAVVVFRKALLLSDDGRLGPSLEGLMARALELSGLLAEAARVRSRALEDVFAVGDHRTALDITVSGLPEAEEVEGDGGIVNRLDRIDADRLDRVDAFRLASHRSRQLAIAGRYEDSRQRALEAMELAEGPSERVQAVITNRFTMSCTTDPNERTALLDTIDGEAHEGDSTRLANYYMVQAIDCYEAGRTDDARVWRSKVDDVPDVPLLYLWQGMQFDTMDAFDQGHLQESRRLREEALAFGLRAGIHGASAANSGAVFVDLWITGRLADFSEMVDDLVGPGRLIDPNASLFHRSGSVPVYLAAGRTEEAVAIAEGIAAEVTSRPVAQRSTALPIVAQALALSKQSCLIGAARRLQEKRGSSSVVLGACVACVGPIDLYLARLAPDHEQRTAHLDAALRVSEEADRALWEAYTLAEIARVNDDADGLARLQERYHETELITIVGG